MALCAHKTTGVLMGANNSGPHKKAAARQLLCCLTFSTGDILDVTRNSRASSSSVTQTSSASSGSVTSTAASSLLSALGPAAGTPPLHPLLLPLLLGWLASCWSSCTVSQCQRRAMTSLAALLPCTNSSTSAVQHVHTTAAGACGGLQPRRKYQQTVTAHACTGCMHGASASTRNLLCLSRPTHRPCALLFEFV